MFLRHLEKKVRKRKTRRGKKKNRKFFTKPIDDYSRDQKQITKSVILNNEPNQSNTGNVQKSGNHANTPSQRSCIGINRNNDHSNTNGNFPVSYVSVVSSVNNSKKAEVISEQKVVITVPDDNVHQTHMAGATGVNICQNNLHETKPDCHNRKDLLILAQKEDGK